MWQSYWPIKISAMKKNYIKNESYNENSIPRYTLNPWLDSISPILLVSSVLGMALGTDCKDEVQSLFHVRQCLIYLKHIHLKIV